MIKKIIVSALMIYSIDALAYANSRSEVYGITTQPNVAFSPSHLFEYGIQNNTHYPQTYNITYSLCAKDQTCTKNTIKVDLASTQRIQQKVYLPYLIMYRNSGHFPITATLKVDGESSHSSIQTAYITVLRG